MSPAHFVSLPIQTVRRSCEGKCEGGGLRHSSKWAIKQTGLVGLILLLFVFLTGDQRASAADYFSVDFESSFGPHLVDIDNAFRLVQGATLPTWVTNREDLEPESSLDRSYLKTADSDYNQVGASNVDVLFDVTLNNYSSGISFVGFGSATPGDLTDNNFPMNSVYLRVLDGSVQLAYQDENFSNGQTEILETGSITSASNRFYARITKQGSLISFSLEDDLGSFSWTASTTIDIMAAPSGGAFDYRFLQDPGNGRLFVGTGREEREFDNLRIYLPGDMNGDGQLNLADVNPMVLALTNRTLYDSTFPDVDVDLIGDLDDSGAFDLGDLGPFSAMFSVPSPAAGNSVPEPSSYALFFSAILLGSSILFERRR